MEEPHVENLQENPAAIVFRNIEERAQSCAVVSMVSGLFVFALGVFLSLTIMGEDMGIPLGSLSIGEGQLHGMLFFYEAMVGMGCANIVVAVRRFWFSRQVHVMQPATILDCMKPVKGVTLALILNLVLGCLVGTVGPLTWLSLRRYVRKNRQLLLASGIRTHSAVAAASAPVGADKWVCKNCGKTNLLSQHYCNDCGKYQS